MEKAGGCPAFFAFWVPPRCQAPIEGEAGPRVEPGVTGGALGDVGLARAG